MIEIFKLLQPSSMFSKIKSMFAASTDKSVDSVDNEQIPFNHPKVDSNNPAACPFAQKKMESASKEGKCPVSGKEAKKEAESESEEQEKPRGGCPFMGGSDKKKNPPLGLAAEGYDEPFVSKFKYYLSANKLDFSVGKRGKPMGVSRELFDKYPIYLQHTLFYNGEDYKKVRGLQCCSRFMAYEELREKGNKYFNKGKYYRALDYYERSLSLFRWLEYHEELSESRLSEHPVSEQSLDQISETGSKIEIPLGEKPEDPTDAFGELKEKYKEFFITYCDDNVRECNGEELTESADLDMRKSLLVQLYLNMAAAYINLQHYSIAESVINDGLALSDRVSQLYFRKAQSIALCKNSSPARLRQAVALVEQAIEMRPNEKIFSTANANILKMLNLHDSAESYAACLEQAKSALAAAEAKEAQAREKIYRRAKEIHTIEMRMIEEGKTPKEGLYGKHLQECSEMRILNRMLRKYQRVIEFYTQAKNAEQVTFAKKELQECLRVAHETQQIFSVQLMEEAGELGELETEKVQQRVAVIKTRFAEEVYNSGRYNFTMLEWAIKEIVKEESQQAQARREEEARLNPPAAVEKKGYGNLVYLLLLIPLALVLLNYFVI